MGRLGLVLFAFAFGVAACRSRGDDNAGRDAAGPIMPTGMLVPNTGGEGGAASSPRVELQIARAGDLPNRTDFEHGRSDSRFLSVEAMTLMHEPFARALPGFDLFLPRLFAAEPLVRLATELDAFSKRSTGPIAQTALELAAFAKETAAKGLGLWVLSP